MVALVDSPSLTFFQEFLVGRNTIDPPEFGVKLSLDEFTDELVNDFNARFRGDWTIDDCLLNPRAAMLFCDDVRHKRGWWMVPDDIILRALLNRRKNPK